MRENLKIKVEAPQYTVVAGVTFAQVDAWFDHTRRDLKMDIIYPEDKTKKYPCVVWICGGAWIRLDRSAHRIWRSLPEAALWWPVWSIVPPMKERFRFS